MPGVQMSEPKNGVERLRETNPVEENRVEGPDSPRARQLLTHILARPREDDVPTRLSARRLRQAVALAVVALVTVAGAWLWFRPIDTPEAILCYREVDINSDLAAAPAGETVIAQACASVWEDETLVNPEVAEPGSIPPLTACVAETGALAVFPTDDTTVCDALGLAYPDPASQERADAVRQLQDQLVSYFQESECIPIAEAEVHIRQLLADFAIPWIIQAQPATGDRPCASFSVDSAGKAIHLIPIPNPGG